MIALQTLGDGETDERLWHIVSYGNKFSWEGILDS
jgi:hypothetical protein